jgi:hypothetical protein
VVATVGTALDNGQGLDEACVDAAARLRILIDEANAIANGEIPAERGDSEEQGEVKQPGGDRRAVRHALNRRSKAFPGG